MAETLSGDEQFPVIARFEIRRRAYLAPDGTGLRRLPSFAYDIALLVSFYRAMVLARAFDLKAVSLQRTGRLGTYAVALGQEAVGVGIASAMREEDVLLPSYRDNAALLWRGVNGMASLGIAPHVAVNPGRFPAWLPCISGTNSWQSARERSKNGERMSRRLCRPLLQNGDICGEWHESVSHLVEFLAGLEQEFSASRQPDNGVISRRGVDPPRQLSRKLLSTLDRLGCVSFRNAFASI